MGIDLSVDLGGLKLNNPILLASGVSGYADEFEDFVDLRKIGGIVTKAISINPKEGNTGERLFETNGGLINRIGLENIGIKEFVAKKIPILKEKKINFIMNLAGSFFEDYIECAKIAQDNSIQAIEVNVSCPNVKSGCLEFGVDPKMLYKLISEIKNVYFGYVIVKLSPNVSDIESLAISAKDAGANCISAINTLKGLGIKIEFQGDKIKKTFVQGGLSGRCIKPVALSMVKRIKDAVNIPVIGIGGICSMQDVLEFFAAGAEAVQIGAENFTNPNCSEVITCELIQLIEKLGLKSLDELKEKLR